MMPMAQTYMPTSTHHGRAHNGSGGRLVTPDGRTLPLRATAIAAEAAAGLARVVLTQQFENPYDEPLAVTYQVPLPVEGAVSGYAFVLGDRRIVGRVDEKKRARERYEQAILDGKSAALLEQDRPNLFTQEVGNIPPRSTVVAEITIDQPLRWLAEGAWEFRFPTTVAPRYMGAAGRVSDAAKLEVPVADRALPVTCSLTLRIDEPLALDARPESASHAIEVTPSGRSAEVSLGTAGARLDRDVVVSWRVAGEQVNTELALARPDDDAIAESSYGLLTLLPPEHAPSEHVSRDLILLLDTSGSMHGEPIEQMRRVSMALVDSLDERDSLSMIEFSMRPTRWHEAPIRCSGDAKRDAKAWLMSLEAGGGTEMHSGILAALEPLRSDAQRQVVLISDGLIGFEEEVVGAILHKLPKGSRVHTVGVGSATNRALTHAAARAGRGHEAIIGIGEDPERIAQRVVAHTAAPLVVDVALSGSALIQAPRRLPDLMAKSPARIALELSPRGGELVVRGNTVDGVWERTLEVPAAPRGSGSAALIKLYGREAVDDLELARAAGESNVDDQVRQLGLRFQIATRLTSWIAVSEERTVDPRDPSRHEEIAHELPHGMSVERLGLRAMGAQVLSRAMPMPMAMPAPASISAGAPPPGYGPPPPAGRGAPPPPAGPAWARRSLRRPADEFAADEPTLDEAGVEPPEQERSDDKPRMIGPAAPPPPPQMAPPKAKSVIRRLVQGVRDVFSARALSLVARLVRHDAQQLTVEIQLSDNFVWSPSACVLVMADGSERLVAIDAATTTKDGRYGAGQLIRLTVRWQGAAPAPLPRTLRLDSDGRELTITF